MSKHYFYIEGNVQKGPVDLEGLRSAGLTKETPVWYDGLPEWTPAGNLPELSEMIYTPPATPPYTPAAAASPRPQPQTYPVNQIPPMPKTWLVESIIVTLLCCKVFGIIGIIYAARVESLWNAKRYDEAEKASRNAGLWTKLGFFFVFILIISYFLVLIIFPAAMRSFMSLMPLYN